MKRILLLSIFILSSIFGYGQTTLINSAGDGGFETGATLALNNWTVVNAATNTWTVGNTPVVASGVRCGYITNASPAWTYNNGTSQTSHIYKTVNFPAGETSITLSFKWKCQGESGFDRLLVYTNTTNPAAGTPASSTTAWGTATLVGGPYNSNTTWQTVNITLSSALAGQNNIRVIFTWQNDGSVGTNPPVALDDVSLITNLPPPAPTNDLCANATSLPCATVNLAGTTVNTVSESAPQGVSSNYGVWYKFTGDGQSTTISTIAGAGFDHELLIMSGTVCGAAYTQITDQDAGGSGGTETYTFTSTLGTQYYVYIAYYSTSGTTANEGTFTISRSCVAAPVPPSNDACGGSTA